MKLPPLGHFDYNPFLSHSNLSVKYCLPFSLHYMPKLPVPTLRWLSFLVP